ncbi:MAG TPA: alpha/beta hydrolase [Usitatibacteraceae bacterium]|jgi:arylformamidase|nr:alpha/beta hydrolase [Usitatibacteraceae bacterium]
MDPLLVPPHLLTPDWVEREYNNRQRVPEHLAFFTRWERDSEYVRQTLRGRLDLPYGPHPRHRVDLFPAPGSDRLLVFFHGGYWRSLDKRAFAWLAPAWVAGGVSVALVNYRLCPEVRIADIVDDAIAALNWLAIHAPVHGAGAGRMVLAGHSAGGHLVGALFAASRECFAFDAARVAGGVPVSGVFDFSPLPHFSGNADLKLDADSARALDLHDRRPTLAAPLVVAVGGAESDEFIRQSRLIAARWAPQARGPLVLPALHHFSVLDALAERGQPLHAATLALF